MKSIQVRRYLCDFCNKGFWRPKIALKHEGRCAMNPKRKCDLCAEYNLKQFSTIRAVVRLSRGYWGLDDLRTNTNGCPFCMLAAVLQSNKVMGWDSRDEDGWYFDFKEQRDKFEEEHNRTTQLKESPF
jgi:hypothetical protein